MRFASVLLTIGWGGMILAALMVLPSLWAVGEGDFSHAGKFFVSALIAMFLSGAFILTGRGVIATNVRKTELFLTAVMFFAILPLLGALPLVGTGHDIGFWAAYFEAASGLTTTGASVYANPEYEASAVLLWRALLGWIGGLWMLGFCVAIIAPFGIGGAGAKAVAIRQSKTETLPRRLRRAVGQIGYAYLGITLLGIFLIWLSGAQFFDALCLSLSAISTTGFVPDLAPIAAYLPPLSIIWLVMLMLLGAVSYPILGAIFVGQFRALKKDPEIKHFLYFILFFTLFMLAAQHTPSPDTISGVQDAASIANTDTAGSLTIGRQLADWARVLGQAFTNAISLLSTTAIAIDKPANPLTGLSALALFIPVMIGGMCLSTAGGLKIMRVALLLKRIMRELKSLLFPRAILHLRYGGRRVSRKQVLGIWLFFIFFLGILAMSLVCAGLFITDFRDAWLASLAALTNAGGIAIMAGRPDLFANLPVFGHIFFVFIMILGRLELFIVLVLFNPTYWQSRH